MFGYLPVLWDAAGDLQVMYAVVCIELAQVLGSLILMPWSILNRDMRQFGTTLCAKLCAPKCWKYGHEQLQVEQHERKINELMVRLVN